VPVPDLPPIAERIELARDRMFQATAEYDRAVTAAGWAVGQPEHAAELARRAATAHDAATELFRLVEAARPGELRPRERSDRWIDAAIGVGHTDYTRRHWEAVVAELGRPADDLQPDDERAKHVVRFRRDAQRNLAVATAESASTADQIRLLERTAANPEHPASEAARAALDHVRGDARLDAIRLREAQDDLDKWEGRYAELRTAASPAGNLAATATPPVVRDDAAGGLGTLPVPAVPPAPEGEEGAKPEAFAAAVEPVRLAVSPLAVSAPAVDATASVKDWLSGDLGATTPAGGGRRDRGSAEGAVRLRRPSGPGSRGRPRPGCHPRR
jgi:hypothetical protein